MDDLTLEHPDLAEHLDGPERRLPLKVRQHVEACRACAAELAELTELRTLAGALPREIRPARDLWTGIESRISREAATPPAATAGVVPIRAVWRPFPRWGGLAAAAVILMVVTAGTTALLLGGGRASSAPVAGTPTTVEAPGGLAAFASAEAEYRYTVETLEAELEARRDALSPATVATVEQNLMIIDNAIAEARGALAADPTSADLPLLLAGVYRRKVELLRQAVDLSARS